ncbi:MAG TPA: aldehyde dehydrogenase family protein, partial [Myxococcota bacterium]|nr:aldehyde dehydrogenase family protein [Myxococcota bacterium]
GNLPTAPALMGNTVVWKPATTSALSSQVVMDILHEAGLPPGVINLVHAPGKVVGDAALTHRDLGGVHFTGSTGTFNHMLATVNSHLSNFRCYPRMVGETGGKDFIVAHPSADVEALVVALVRGAFEFQGQKCSAASRAYIPEGLWKEVSGRLEAEVNALKVGDPTNFENFMGAVIDAKSFKNIKGYIEHARSASGGKVWLGGDCNDREGWFIEPTVVLADDPQHKLLCEEIFGPVLTIHRYPDAAFSETLALVDNTSPYALTGAIFAQDRAAVNEALRALRFAAGNFYINDKPTGAVVGQQPFGGGRASGTNDKAGSILNLQRWVSPRTIKETFA